MSSSTPCAAPDCERPLESEARAVNVPDRALPEPQGCSGTCPSCGAWVTPANPSPCQQERCHAWRAS